MVNIRELFDILPHRYPMMLIDRVLEFEPGVRCKGLKNVTINEPYFVGHYPAMPIMPGVLIIEAMAQASCIMVLTDPLHAGKMPLIAAIDNVKFRRPVTPGDTLISDIELVWFRNDIGKIKAVGSVNGETVASMELSFKLVPREG